MKKDIYSQRAEDISSLLCKLAEKCRVIVQASDELVFFDIDISLAFCRKWNWRLWPKPRPVHYDEMACQFEEPNISITICYSVYPSLSVVEYLEVNSPKVSSWSGRSERTLRPLESLSWAFDAPRMSNLVTKSFDVAMRCLFRIGAIS